MAKTSKYTKSTRTKYWVLKVISLLLLFAPLLAYIGIALSTHDVIVVEKVALVGSVAVALLLTTINFISKRNLRSPIWIILLGLYFAMGEFLMPLIISLAVASTLDDLLFRPLTKYYKTKLIASKTIDDRM